MRILHVIGSLGMGGSQAMVMSLYRAIDRQQMQFDFVLDTQTEGVFENEIRQLGGRIYYVPKFNGRNGAKVRSAWHKFFREHPEYKILHSHVRSYASLYLPIAKKNGLKTVVHSHNTSNGKGIASVGKWLLQYPLRHQADYFFGCSEWAGQWLFGKKVVKSDRYYMLKNAVDMDRFAFRPEIRQQIRQELGAEESTRVLGHVGRMNVQKNHAFLLRAFRDMVDAHPDTLLVLLGDGELREAVEKQIRELSLEKHVRVLGVKENAQEYMSAMDALLLPSLHEGLPVVVVEAQAAGLPCLIADTITREVALSELVHYLPINEGTEPWVKAMDEVDFARKDVAEALAQQGFSVTHTAKWLCRFYQEILDK